MRALLVADFGMVLLRIISSLGPVVGKDVPHYAESHKGQEQRERDPLDARLPALNSAVVQHEDADQEAGEGAAKVADEAGAVAAVRVEADVDGERDVVRG